VYCFDAAKLLAYLPKLTNTNAQKEYYLTDLVSLFAHDALDVVGKHFQDGDVFLGVNDRWQLAEVAVKLNRRILRQHALNGVTLSDPSSTVIGPDVQIGSDTVIEPFCQIMGKTVIGAQCTIGPNSKLMDSTVGEGCEVLMSHLNRSTMEKHSRCGPFANLRPGAVLGVGAKVGNFVEVKNATLEKGVSVSHLSYIGDGHVGAGSNIGAGTIFCNYDGFRKHRTVIGTNAFIGSNSTLVAPVTIGDGVMVAAGSVITQSVDDGALAIGRARQENKAEWATHWRKQKAANREDQDC
jgi:bifunctional UDP-N-acetylglucosamine pyrophosphorylase/glucosamine-1-phosphate N-acetyltransferase